MLKRRNFILDLAQQVLLLLNFARDIARLDRLTFELAQLVDLALLVLERALTPLLLFDSQLVLERALLAAQGGDSFLVGAATLWTIERIDMRRVGVQVA